MCNLFYGRWSPTGAVVRDGIYKGLTKWFVDKSMKKNAYVLWHLFEANIQPDDGMRYIEDFDAEQHGVSGSGLSAIIAFEHKKSRDTRAVALEYDDVLKTVLADPSAVVVRVSVSERFVDQPVGFMPYVREGNKLVVLEPVPKTAEKAKKAIMSIGERLIALPARGEEAHAIERNLTKLHEMGLDSPVVKRMREKLAQ